MDVASTAGVGGKFEPKRLVAMAYLIFALAGGMFFSRVVAALISGLRIAGGNDLELLGVEGLTASLVIGFALSIGGVLFCYLNPRIHAGSLDIAAELKRVTWPSAAETRVSTVAVIIASLVAAGVLFTFDFVSSKLMTQWVPTALEWMTRI